MVIATPASLDSIQDTVTKDVLKTLLNVTEFTIPVKNVKMVFMPISEEDAVTGVILIATPVTSTGVCTSF